MSLKRRMYHSQKNSFYSENNGQSSYKSLCCIQGSTFQDSDMGSFATNTNSLLVSWLADLQPCHPDDHNSSCGPTELQEAVYDRDSVLDTALYQEKDCLGAESSIVAPLDMNQTNLSFNANCTMVLESRTPLTKKVKSMIKSVSFKSKRLSKFSKKFKRLRLSILSRANSKRT